MVLGRNVVAGKVAVWTSTAAGLDTPFTTDSSDHLVAPYLFVAVVVAGTSEVVVVAALWCQGSPAIAFSLQGTTATEAAATVEAVWTKASASRIIACVVAVVEGPKSLDGVASGTFVVAFVVWSKDLGVVTSTSAVEVGAVDTTRTTQG